jgi:3-methyladenine DNA glycosylase AlkD
MKFSAIKFNKVSSKVEKILEKKQNNKSLEFSNNVKTVGIIVNEGSGFNFEMLKELQRQIATGSENFYILTCKDSSESYNEFRGAIFYEKQFNWNGVLQSKQVNDFLENQFDMLIDYTNADTVFKKYLVAKSKAKFKVGLANIDNRLYDFMIALNTNDIRLFNKELVKYLKILKKVN